MARMMRENRILGRHDLRGEGFRGRARENREWRSDWEAEAFDYYPKRYFLGYK
ncbi:MULTISPECIES: hypothetical protein [unclassified Nocardia]|uniref:hypothetical protein n=1 Tax=unclassified Nocardia TaxID=2637762 RepID=UPI001CE4B038|nr:MULTISPECIES: hypothetical protein [unclassified Nocardia]